MHRPISGVYASAQLRAGRPGGALGLITRHGDRFFAQPVLASRKRQDRPLHVLVVGKRDVHRVNARISEQRLVGAVWFYAIEPSGGGLCTREVA
jgi:hypothetical protein